MKEILADALISVGSLLFVFGLYMMLRNVLRSR